MGKSILLLVTIFVIIFLIFLGWKCIFEPISVLKFYEKYTKNRILIKLNEAQIVLNFRICGIFMILTSVYLIFTFIKN